MGRMPQLGCLWPGLVRLWRDGSGVGLAIALGFAALVNFQLVTSLVWTGILPLNIRWAVGGLTFVCWAIGAVVFLRRERGGGVVSVRAGEDLFREAQTEYLQGNWFEAETLLSQIVRANPRDADARLMLATLKRHTSRLDEAEGHLARLERLDAGRKWQLEIGKERKLLDAARIRAVRDNGGPTLAGSTGSTPTGPNPTGPNPTDTSFTGQRNPTEQGTETTGADVPRTDLSDAA